MCFSVATTGPHPKDLFIPPFPLSISLERKLSGNKDHFLKSEGEQASSHWGCAELIHEEPHPEPGHRGDRPALL